MFRGIAPRYRDGELTAHPHRLVLRGQPGDVAFPPLCPNCGVASTETLPLERVFARSDSDGPTRYEHVGIVLPVCSACAAQHRAQTVLPTFTQRIVSSFATFDMVGAVMLVVAALFCLWLAAKDFLKGRLLSGLFPLGLAGMFALFARAQQRAAWDDTARFRVPRPSEVANAFDFSDDLSAAFEKPRFAVTMKSASFAEAFEALNASRLYQAGSAEAIRETTVATRKTRWILAAMVVVLVIAWLLGY